MEQSQFAFNIIFFWQFFDYSHASVVIASGSGIMEGSSITWGLTQVSMCMRLLWCDYVPSKFICRNPRVQIDGIRKQDHWAGRGVIKSREHALAKERDAPESQLVLRLRGRHAACDSGAGAAQLGACRPRVSRLQSSGNERPLFPRPAVRDALLLLP